MRQRGLWVILLLPLLGGPAAGQVDQVDQVDQAAPAGLRQEVRRMIAAARDRVFPALVHIEAATVQYAGGEPLRGRSAGSGVLISPQGHVLTNHHVVLHGVRFDCVLADQRRVAARLVGSDPLTDLAVLQLDLADPALAGRQVPTVELGDSAALETGDYVLAMGSPYSLSRSVTLGIVSNTARIFSPALLGPGRDGMELEPGQRTGLFTLWIQHDALINPGNSGGPLVDLAGRVVGINELGGSGVGFAIPSNLARDVAAALIAHGEVARSTLGVSVGPVPAELEPDGPEEPGQPGQPGHPETGALVEAVHAGGPAARAGLRPGDVLLALDGRPLAVRYPEDVPGLLRRIADLPAGTELKLRLRRGERVSEIAVRTERLGRDREPEAAVRAWGLTAQQLTPRAAARYGLTRNAGVVVTGVRGGGPAQLAQPALEPGDVLSAVDGRPVATLADLLAFLEPAGPAKPGQAGSPERAAADPAGVLVEIDRRGQSLLALLRVPASTVALPAREIPKPWLGIATQPVPPELAEQLGAGAGGYRITRVYPHTAAAAAGLQVGDLVVALNGEDLAPRGLEDAGLLDARVRRLEIGETAVLTLVPAGGKAGDGRQERRVALAGAPLRSAEAGQAQSGDFGLTVREVTFFDRAENGWGEAVQGVLVERVESTGWAEEAGLRPGDLLQQVAGGEVPGIESFSRRLAEVAAARPRSVAFTLRRGADDHFAHVEPDWDGAVSAVSAKEP